MSTMTDSNSTESYNEVPDPTGSGSHMNERNDSFNGYANRETWAFNLHWQNDQGFYNFVLEFARTTLDVNDGEPLDDGALGQLTVDYVRDELPELSPQLWESMREDVGSWWRIDEAEVGEAVRESLEAES